MKIDVMAIAVHPDDVELSCAGTLMKSKAAGKKIGVIDLTRGELGTRGSAETRDVEAKASSEILGLDIRENLSLPDGFFQYSKENQLKIIQAIRKYQPDTVLINAISDRHPDHGKASLLSKDACYLSGLPKVVTEWQGEQQEAWRPKQVFHYIQDYYRKPDFVIDISEQMERKIEAIKAFKTQFYDPNSSEPDTPISGEEFFQFIKGRWADFGRYIGAEYGEGFEVVRPIGVEQITDIY